MTANEIANLWTEYYPLDQIERKINGALSFNPEDITHAIPSIQLGQDGLRLSNLVLVSESFLCEVRFESGNIADEFDYVAKNTIFNYRVKTWTHEVKEEDVVKAVFEIAEVTLRHEGGEHLQSKIDFAGSSEDRDVWLALIREALSLSTLLKYARSV